LDRDRIYRIPHKKFGEGKSSAGRSIRILGALSLQNDKLAERSLTHRSIAPEISDYRAMKGSAGEPVNRS
jgi:hypothetical protein